MSNMPKLSVRASLCAFAFASALASLPAWAKPEADCKQDYAAQKATGESAGQSQAQYVKACLAAETAGPAEGWDDVEGDTKGQSNTDLAKKIQNPIGDLYSFPFEAACSFMP